MGRLFIDEPSANKEEEMRQDVVVEILPDGRAALRLVILPPEPPRSRESGDEGVIEIPLYPPEDEEAGNVIVWKM